MFTEIDPIRSKLESLALKTADLGDSDTAYVLPHDGGAILQDGRRVWSYRVGDVYHAVLGRDALFENPEMGEPRYEKTLLYQVGNAIPKTA